MSALVKLDDLNERLPAPDEVRSAKELRAIMAPFSKRNAPAHIQVTHGRNSEEFHLAPAVAKTLLDVLDQFAAGKAVTLIPVGANLTTQQAADVLNVSRPYLIKLLERGEISFERVGRHRRVATAELFAYKKRRDQERRSALDAIAALDGEEGDL